MTQWNITDDGTFSSFSLAIEFVFKEVIHVVCFHKDGFELKLPVGFEP